MQLPVGITSTRQYIRERGLNKYLIDWHKANNMDPWVQWGCCTTCGARID